MEHCEHAVDYEVREDCPRHSFLSMANANTIGQNRGPPRPPVATLPRPWTRQSAFTRGELDARVQSHPGAPGSAHYDRRRHPRRSVGRQYLGRSRIGDAHGMFELLSLVLLAVRGLVRPRQDLVLENLLLRHQLAVLTRPTRTRPRLRLRAWDKLVWILARRFCAWRNHLVLVAPDTVVRRHRQGWRLFWRWKTRHPGGRPC